MSAKLEQVLNCSLDDYIAKKGIVSSLRTKSVEASGANYFKRPLRSEDDDEETDDFFEDRNGMEVEETNGGEADDDLPPLVRVATESGSKADQGDSNGSGETRPTNVSIKLDSDRECRTFVTEEHKRGIKHMPSQQWRLRRENQVAMKPIGVPPLTTVKAIFDRNTEQLIASLGEHAKFHSDDARDRINQRLQNNNGRQWNNNNRNRSGGFQQNRNNFQQNRNHRNNNIRNQYGKNPNMVASFNPNVDRLEQRSSTQIDKNQIRDLRPFITPPSSLQSQSTGAMVPIAGVWDQPPSTQMGQQQMVTFAEMLSQISRAADNQNRDMFADVIRNVVRTQQQQQQQPSAAMVPMMIPDNVSRMNSAELMPFAAQTVLNHISTVQQNFGPKYDMKVQKEIHALQGKTMLYRANGVVSMDGAGVGNERVKPTTTDLSMNMRFS